MPTSTSPTTQRLTSQQFDDEPIEVDASSSHSIHGAVHISG